jgi:hypothetical protein
MKRLIAAAIAAVAIGVPAQAAPVTGASIATTKAILTKLVQVGVTIATPTICPSDMWGEYNYSTATLTLCPDTLKNDAMAVETIAHEAIHAAQHCVGGPLVSTVSPNRVDGYAERIVAAIGHKSRHVLRVTENLSEAARVREYEAYAFEGHPDLVLQILNKVCR